MSARIRNPRFPHTIKIWRETGSDDPFVDTVTTVILYEGVGRSYTDTTTTGDGKVISNRRKAAIPMRCDDWTEFTDIHSGDIISVTLNTGIVEEGKVSDREVGTMGTNIVWEFVRN